MPAPHDLGAPGEVILLTIGALTNVAQLVREEQGILTKLSSHVAMLGYWTGDRVEHNVLVNTEAARIVCIVTSSIRDRYECL